MGTHTYLGAILKSLVWVSRRPGFVHSWSEVQISRSVRVRAKVATRVPVMQDKKRKKDTYNPGTKSLTDCSVSNEKSVFICFCFRFRNDPICRSQCGLRRRSAEARLLRSWVRIPAGAWMFVCCDCYVLSGRGLCKELITRPEESYRLWCVVVCNLETS